MQAAWKVTGEPKKDVSRVANDDKLDYELFDRWIKFLAKPPKFYPYLTEWQAMIKSGGSAAEAKTLADEFQALLVDVMFEKKDVDEENEIIEAKALPGTKKKKPANLPNEFITNDDFCPGCGLELKSLSTERMQLWTDVFRRDLEEGFEPSVAEYVEAGPARLPRLGPRTLSERRPPPATSTTCATTSRRCRRRCRRSSPTSTACRTPTRPPISRSIYAAIPIKLGDEVPRRFLTVLSDGEPVPFTKGSGRLELADAIVKQPLAMRVIVNRVWKGHFGTGLVNTPSNFGENGERPTHPELLEYLALVVRRSRWFDQEAASRDHAERRLSAERGADSAANIEKDAGNRLYWRASRRRLTAEQIRDSVLFVSGALDDKMGGPSAPLTPWLQPPDDLRQGEPLQARRVPAAVRLPERRPCPPSSASRPTCRCSACSS